MAVTSKMSEQAVLEFYKGEHDVESDDLRWVLMDDAFVFDPATHATYADISSDEIATGFGYTQLTKTVDTVAASIVSNEVVIDCDSPVWTAAGGAIPSTAAACIVNNSHANKTVLCCIEFGAAYATADTKQFQINCSAGIMNGEPNPA